METSVMTDLAPRIPLSNENGEGESSAMKVQFAFDKKIEFLPARKQYSGIRNNGDFKVETLNPDAGQGRKRQAPMSGLDASPSGKKVEGPEFGDFGGLDPEIYLGTTFRRIGAGLENLGNTCFLNSVLQCLTYTEPLAAYLQSGKHQNSCHIAGFCALCAIQKHVSRALQSTGRSLVPKDLVANLRCISRNFRSARQEDAHEYMVNLLESMHKCCLPSRVPSESPAAYEKSLVHKIFGGHLRSQVECQQCFHCSNKFDPFLDLSLEIVRADSLPLALRNFTAAELLDGGEKHYQCQRCKQKVRAKKRLTVHKPPYVLSIHLKRFHAHDPTRKVDKKVSFDRSLDMKPFVSGSNEGDLKYSLYGVLVHFGHSTHSGHYVCFVRTSSGMWYLLNDNEVRQVGEKHVLDQKAYMLFYVRDRKPIVPRKPVGLVCKDNMKATVGTSIEKMVPKQVLKEHVDNSLIGNNKPHPKDAPSAVNQEDASHDGTSKETLPSSRQNNGVIRLGSSALKAEPSSNAPLSKDLLKETPLLNQDQGECLSTCASVNIKTNDSKLEGSNFMTGLKSNVPGEMPSNCSDTPKDGADVSGKNESSNKVNLVPNKEVLGVSGDRTMDDVHVQPLFMDNSTSLDSEGIKGQSCTGTQGGGISCSASGNSSSDLVGERDQKNDTELVKATVLDMPSEHLNDTAPDFKVQKKLKKKLSRFHTPIMHLGLKMCKISLRIRKKKNKKVKHRTADTQNLIKQQLLGTSEMGPSTSINSIDTPVSSNSQRKVTKSGARKRDNVTKYSSDSLMDGIGGEYRGKVDNDVQVPIDNQLLKFSASAFDINHQEAGELSHAENSKRIASHNCVTRMHTQELEETTVARWEGIELPSSLILDTGAEKLGVGYVLDEWDEEYDQGKRKKLRQKRDFSGPNPFQEFATKKMQFKTKKNDRSSSRHQPFRI